MIYTTDIDCRIKTAPKDLMDEPVTILVNKFDEETAKLFREQVAKAHQAKIRQPVIPVIIDSLGGEVYSLISMISTIEKSEIPVATIVDGKAMSCGAILFSFGTEGKRYMSAKSHLMIHDVSHGAFGKVQENEARVKQTTALNKQIFADMARNCGKEPGYFTKIVHDLGRVDWYLSAKEARKHNLCNKIGIPILKTKVTVEVTFE